MFSSIIPLSLLVPHFLLYCIPPAAMASPISIYPNIPCGVPLVLKARCEDRIKRIRFPPELTLLSFRDFHRRISKALRFDDMEFSITWCDDDGEQVSSHACKGKMYSIRIRLRSRIMKIFVKLFCTSPLQLLLQLMTILR